jgi:antitoxin (DNA-binding transcriptional repressor) of toxin-antitoxin stability system
MTTHKVSKSVFKAKALEYFRLVESTGESVIITDHGTPTLEVRPYRKAKRDPLRELRGTVLRFDDPFAPVGEGDWESLK